MKHRLLLILLLGLILGISSLSARAPYYPLTSIAEGFFASWCVTCHDGMAGIDVVDATAHNGELINLRYYTTSANLSSPSVDDRIAHYEVFGVPVMIFNGKIRIDGGGANITDGSRYLQAYSHFRNAASPLKMQVLSFNASSGAISIQADLITPDMSINDESIYFLIVEDDVDANATRVVRQIASQTFSISQNQPSAVFNHTFTMDPTWNSDNLWAVAFVQKDDNSIIQTCSTLPLPEHHLRAAADWDLDNIVVGIGELYESPAIWYYNLGVSDNYEMQIVVDETPANWYFNYCDEDGFCLPGGFPMPVSIAADSTKGYHLNIMVGDSGIAKGRIRLTSAGLGTYDVPFRMRTSDVSNADLVQSPAAISISQYPNPFSGVTGFRIESSKLMQNAHIDIFNSRGQRVDSIHIPQTDGTINLDWIAPARLSSGIYYYKLRGENSPARRMLLVR